MSTPIPLMIDSGAYSAYSVGKEIKLDEYIAFCHEMKKLHPHAVFIGLDVVQDPVQSWKNWMRMRKEGVRAVPVHQILWGDEWLKKYLDKTDHIGLAPGTFDIRKSATKRQLAYDQVWERFLIDKDRMPKYRVHGMAVTSFRLMARYPWHSVDSTSWLKASRCGSILVPKRKAGKWDWTVPPKQVGVSCRDDNSTRGGRHYENLGPTEQQQVLQYLKELGLRMGFRVRGRDGGWVLVRGVSTYYGDRDHVNMEAYASFLQHLPYPRPFLKKRMRGFGIMA